MRKRVVAYAGAVLVGVAALAIGAKPIYAPKNTVPPAVSGATEVGDQLACTTGSWTRSPSGYVYSWENSPDGSTWSVIGGATSTPYTLVEADETKTVRCRVTATKGNTSGQAVSTAVGPVTSPSEDFFVATTGSDSNPGTSGSPFLTLDKCYDTMSTGEICEVAAGEYAHQAITGTKAGEVTIQCAGAQTCKFGGWTQLDSGAVGGNNSVTWNTTGPHTVTIDGTGTGTDAFPTTASGSCTGGVTCNKIIIGTANLDCPTSGRASGGWTGCTLTNLSGGVSCGGSNPCKWYDGAEIKSSGTGLAISGADYVELQGFATYSVTVSSDGSTKATNVTIRDSRMYASSVSDADDVLLEGNTIGGSSVADVNFNLQVSSGATCCVTDLTINDNEFVGTDRRDCGDTLNSACHTECFFLRHGNATGVSGVTITRNNIHGCADFGIFIEGNSGGAPSGPLDDVTIENNFFDRQLESPGGCGVGDGCTPVKSNDNAINFKQSTIISGFNNWRIAFNSCASSFCIGVGASAPAFTNTVVKGNLGWHGIATNICTRTGVTCTDNFWGNSGGACPSAGETNVTCSVVFANIFENENTAVDVAPDLHIQTSPAPSPNPLGYVPTGCPALDFDGDARPATNCDVGADEQ
jgi:hypothetical protein